MVDKAKIATIIELFAKGEMIIVVDDNSRENEGDLIVAAQYCNKEQMGFIIRYSSGIICVPISCEIAQRLNLPPMVKDNSSAYNTAFTVSVDSAKDTSTGISGAERALTANKLADAKAVAQDFVRPGHVFPLLAKEGGLLVRSGHTEAAVDLCKMANLAPAAVIGELMNDDGTVQHGQQIIAFAKKHNLPIVSIEELIAYRQCRENLTKLIEKRKFEHLEEYQYEVEYSPYRYIVKKFLHSAKQSWKLVFSEEDFILDDNVIYIALELKSEGNLLAKEDHIEAKTREERWYKIGAIGQILRELSIKQVTLYHENFAEYSSILSDYDIELSNLS